VDADDLDDVEDSLLWRSGEPLSCEAPSAISSTVVGKLVALRDPCIAPSLTRDEIDPDESEQVSLSEPYICTSFDPLSVDVSLWLICLHLFVFPAELCCPPCIL
jgi:hypothetical protein